MTEEDRLLRDLGRLARGEKESEKAHFDERWDRLAAGTLTAEEEAELMTLAETSPEAREALEAFRPLGAEFQARVVEAVAAELRSAAENEGGAREPRPRPSSPRRSASGRWGWRWLVPVGAAAAALLLFLRSPAPLPLLSTYEIRALEGGRMLLRGAEESNQRIFAPGLPLRLDIHPDGAVTGPIAVRAFLARGAEMRTWKPEVEISDTGSVRLDGTLGQDLQPGTWKVWVVVGRRGKIPSKAKLEGDLRAGRTRDDFWQAVSKDFRVEDQVPP